jgi:hypothetical protein
LEIFFAARFVGVQPALVQVARALPAQNHCHFFHRGSEKMHAVDEILI